MLQIIKPTYKKQKKIYFSIRPTEKKPTNRKIDIFNLTTKHYYHLEHTERLTFILNQQTRKWHVVYSCRNQLCVHVFDFDFKQQSHPLKYVTLHSIQEVNGLLHNNKYETCHKE